MSSDPRSSTARNKRRAIVRKGQPPCWLCGKPIDYTITDHLDPMSFVVDHAVALAQGGTDTPDNWRPAHRSCNSAKSDRLDGGPVLRRSGTLVRPGV